MTEELSEAASCSNSKFHIRNAKHVILKSLHWHSVQYRIEFKVPSVPPWHCTTSQTTHHPPFLITPTPLWTGQSLSAFEDKVSLSI